MGKLTDINYPLLGAHSGYVILLQNLWPFFISEMSKVGILYLVYKLIVSNISQNTQMLDMFKVT